MDNTKVIITLGLSVATIAGTAIVNTIAGIKEKKKYKKDVEQQVEVVNNQPAPQPQPVVAPLRNPQPHTVAQQAAATHFAPQGQSVMQQPQHINANPAVSFVGYNAQGQPVYVPAFPQA